MRPGFLVLIIAWLMISRAPMGAEPKAAAPVEEQKGAVAKEVAKSAEQLEWEAQVQPSYRNVPALAYVKDDPALPRMLLIGDSISVGYTTRVQRALAGKVNVHRVPINGGSTLVGLEHIEQWLGKKPWDVIHFNWGLHDLSRRKNDKPDITGERNVSLEQYEKNLEQLVARLEKTGAKLIFATTTPIPKGAPGYLPGSELEYNAVAVKVMKKHGVQINDLYACAKPRMQELQPPADVHFKDEGSLVLAQQVADATLIALKEKTAAAKK